MEDAHEHKYKRIENSDICECRLCGKRVYMPKNKKARLKKLWK